MTRWIFIRHGESVANRERWLSGHRDAPLTPKGREQAANAATQLAQMSFTRAYASDLQRAMDTARLVLDQRDIALQSTKALRERSCGVFEGTHYDEAYKSGLSTTLDAFDGVPQGGESLRDTAVRALGFLSSLRSVGSHGALMRALIGSLDGVPPEEISNWRPKNCEWVERTVSTDRWATLYAALQ